MATTVNVPSKILEIRAVYQAELERIAKIQALEAEAIESWRKIGTTAPNKNLLDEPIKYAAKRALGATVEAAAEELCFNGTRPIIDREEAQNALLGDYIEYRKAHGFEAGATSAYWLRFDAVALWEYLKNTYCPEIVNKQALKEAALDLRLVFDLYQHRSGFSEKGGSARLGIPMITDIEFGPGGQVLRSYKHMKHSHRLMDSLERFMEATNQTQSYRDMLRGIFELYQDLVQGNRKFTLREKVTFPGGGAMTFYTRKLMITLPISVAQDLVMFVSEHLWNN